MIRTVALGVVCLAGLGAIAAAAKKSPPLPPEVVMPLVGGNKADRLPLIQPIRHFGDAQPIPFAAISNRADLFERAALRGGIENVLFAAVPPSPQVSGPPAPTPPASNARKTRHNATRATAVVTVPVDDDPQPSSPPPSLLEKLFDAIVPVSPRQT